MCGLEGLLEWELPAVAWVDAYYESQAVKTRVGRGKVEVDGRCIWGQQQRT